MDARDNATCSYDSANGAWAFAAVPLVEDVAQLNATTHFAISNQGALVYVPRDAIGGFQPRTLVWVDRQRREVPIKGVPPRMYFYPRLSPDGTRVALDVRDEAHDIWIWHLARETLERLTLEPTFEEDGVWAPDGKTVIYASRKLGVPLAPRSLFRRSSDFTGTAEPLIQGTVAQIPSTVTPDGTALRGVNYFCRLATTISAGEGPTNERAGDRSRAR